MLIILLVGLRSLLGPANCYYEIGCTQFAIMQLEDKPLFTACKIISLRLLSCNPVTVFYRNIVCSKKGH